MAQNRFLQSPGFENIVSVSTMFPALCLQRENRSQQKGGRIPEDTLGQIFLIYDVTGHNPEIQSILLWEVLHCSSVGEIMAKLSIW